MKKYTIKDLIERIKLLEELQKKEEDYHKWKYRQFHIDRFKKILFYDKLNNFASNKPKENYDN